MALDASQQRDFWLDQHNTVRKCTCEFSQRFLLFRILGNNLFLSYKITRQQTAHRNWIRLNMLVPLGTFRVAHFEPISSPFRAHFVLISTHISVTDVTKLACISLTTPITSAYIYRHPSPATFRRSFPLPQNLQLATSFCFAN